MKSWVKQALRTLPAVAAFIAFASAPVIGAAQQPPPIPSYAVPSYAVKGLETIKGTISSFNGTTTIYVRDVRGYTDDVTLHRGTIINPTGIRLQSGYPVTITGHPSGSTFVADQIDTPFRPVYGYGYPAYPYYSYPYYPYPAYSLSLGWGWGGWGWRR